MRESEPSLRPIGVFDSGIGGLTVVRALRDLLPHEDIFYIGDTARLPYGGKSKSTIERYSIEISGLLLAENAKMIVVACNTSSSLAISKLQEILKVPVVGVIAPGARAAVKETRIGHVGVIGTKSTIQSEAYERAIQALNPAVRVTSQACPLLVPLVEEAWLEEEVTREVLHRYLDPVVARRDRHAGSGVHALPVVGALDPGSFVDPEFCWLIPRRTVRSPSNRLCWNAAWRI